MTETVFSSSKVWKWMMLEDMEDLEAGAYMMLQTTGSVNHIQLFTWENLMKSNISIIPNSKLRLHSGIQMWGWIKVSKWDCLVICFCIDIIKKIVLSDTKYCTAPKKLVTAKLKKKKKNEWMMHSSSTWAENIKGLKFVDKCDTFALTFLPPLGTSWLLFGSLVPFLPQVPGSHNTPCELWDPLLALITCSAIARTVMTWWNKSCLHVEAPLWLLHC